MAAHVNSARTRLLSLRRRLDLVAVAQTIQGERVWAIKDPLSLQYFHLRDSEYWIFQQLNGRTTLASLIDEFAERFAPQRLHVRELQGFLATLHQSGLVIAGTPGQGEELLRRHRSQRRQRFWQTFANPLAIRFRGVDPDRFLTACAARLRWLFSPATLVLGAALICTAVLLVLSHFETVLARLPTREAFFSADNLIWLAFAMAGVKVTHELGHALLCKHLGGECHELGLMLLLGTPCLYCNVSDAWMLPDKWQRAAVGLAGVGVELCLAAGASILWWSSAPGAFNSLCFNVMVVCSVGTLLINGNPLLRYDGYYVLSDLVEVPNLASQGAAALKGRLARWILGIELPVESEVAEGRPAFLIGYAVLSLAYRLSVLFGVLWFIHRTLQPWRLEILAEMLAVAVVGGLVAFPMVRGAQFLKNPYWRRQVQKPRAALGIAGVLLAAGLLLAVPLPHRIAAAALVQPVDAARIFATVPGRLVDSRREGETVAADGWLATLENSELEGEIARLQGERNQQRLRVEILKRRQVIDDSAAAQLPAAEELLAALEARLAQKRLDNDRLTIVSSRSGTILPPRQTPARNDEGMLPLWTGTPFTPRNRGCRIEAGELLCLVGDPARLEAFLVVAQEDVEAVAPGQAVQLRLDQSPGEKLSGVVSEVSEINLSTTPPELISHGMLATRTDASGRSRPASTSYLVRVSLPAIGRAVLVGEAGRSWIETPPRSLGARLLRLFRRTFEFDLTGH